MTFRNWQRTAIRRTRRKYALERITVFLVCRVLKLQKTRPCGNITRNHISCGAVRRHIYMEASGLSKEAVIQRLLDVIENDIIPVNMESVKKGEPMFGAAILKLSDLSLVCVGVNHATECPLWHAEVACIQNFWELPAEGRPHPSECLILATHEPCSMCISAITWSAFPEVHFLFSMDDNRDVFNMPHDRRIFREVFQCEKATRENALWKAYDIPEVVETLPDGAEAIKIKINALRATYASLSDMYQSSKDSGKSSSLLVTE